MSTESAVRESVSQAASTVGSVWPLHSFVTANPLAGFEDRPFHEATARAEALLGGDGYPSVDVFRRAWETGQIDADVLRTHLADHGYDADPETLLGRMAAAQSGETRASVGSEPTADTATDRVDAVLTKWLAAFLDQGQAAWSMPNREEGFYAAFRAAAPYDSRIPDRTAIADLPDEPIDAIRERLSECPVGRWTEVFEFQLAALPGWTGFIKQRAADEGAWQSRYPITLVGYLAVRLTLVDLFDAPLEPTATSDADADDADADENAIPLPELWLRAWEATYRRELVDRLTDASAAHARESGVQDDQSGVQDDRPDAQLVFCIDTRSEVLRRHIEAAGNYETHGYAGFFGIPMRYTGYGSKVTVDACPPIVDAQHRITERPAEGRTAERDEHERWHGVASAARTVVKDLRSNAATVFSFVESAGLGYGASLAARTLLPSRVYDLFEAVDERVVDDHEFCEASFDPETGSSHELPAGLTLEERVEYAATAFELLGWEQFARVVVFAGHGSQTTNNPFESSLDCGACAGNAGGPNARVLAQICNDEAVKSVLRDRGFDIPTDTVFLAAEHNTTTDDVELYAGPGDVPASHAPDVERLRADLAAARAGAAAERVGADGDRAALREVERRAADWAETRPEWGLAGNAGFVIGPRALTEGLDLDGRAFLHSYDWRTDADGDALEAILTGPMVVTQWINSQYYFATVDNAVYGSGSKVTQNPVGNVGVYQGNGGDILGGLPLQSLMSGADEPYHQPLRLSTVLHAPVDRVTDVLTDHEKLVELLDNGWLSLTVVDPTQGHRAFNYAGELEWTGATETATAAEAAPTAAPEASVADD
ncbi:DUF2309 domain-containing protein [Halobellus sp. Atlit-31R]|nr:DUF2309 domain-containing protein [Halobellus sp. Atlit-31R]